MMAPMPPTHDPPRGARAVLVTDAREGLGRATALLLAEGGDCVLACAPDLAGLDDLPRETMRGGVIELAHLDLTDGDLCTAALTRGRDLFGRIDAIVHTAVATHFGPVEELDDATTARVFAANFYGPLNLIRRAVPELRARGEGTIVCVASAAGQVALPLSAMLSASHHALEALCDALRLELHTFGIDVVLVETGLVRRGVVVATADRIEEALRGVGASSPYAPLARGIGTALRALERTAATPREVAEVVRRALRAARPRPRYAVTRRTAAWIWARKVLPDRVIDGRLVRAMGLKPPRR